MFSDIFRDMSQEDGAREGYKNQRVEESWKLDPEGRKALCITKAQSNGHVLGDWQDGILPDKTNPETTYQISKSFCEGELPKPDSCVADAWYFKDEGEHDFMSYGGLALNNNHGHAYSSRFYNQRLAAHAKEVSSSSSVMPSAFDLAIESIDKTLLDAARNKMKSNKGTP